MTEPGRKPTWVPSWLRDPLIHFLVIGGMLFAAYGLLGPDGNDPNRITVSRDALINFAQYRVNTFQFDLVELYDLEQDPMEYDNLKDDPAHASLIAELSARLARGWRGELPPSLVN